MTERSIVEYFAEHEGYKCGYCKLTNTCYSHGMWAHVLNPVDYQNLIDRGWRRSGKYCYKPTMKLICCPQYAIRCETKKFVLSKSQKKVLKKVHKFLAYGQNEKNSPTPSDDTGEQVMDVTDFYPSSDIQGVKHMANVKEIMATEISDNMTELDCDKGTETSQTEGCIDAIPSLPNSVDAKENVPSQLQDSEPRANCSQKSGSFDPTKPPCRKAKEVRREKRLQKLLKAGKTIEEVKTLETKKTSQSKSIEDFLSESFPCEPRHKLELRLVPSDCESEDFMSTFDETYDLYKRYQMAIHGDTEEECDQDSFEDFLVVSPIKHSTGHVYGSFHQQYWLDDKLMAVGVIDILPFSISSVYFYYDPDYRFLSLGTYAALREIAFTRELNERYQSLRYYYMGFYIHSCVKMRYKGQYQPSFLLCPETFIFQNIERCRPKLDASKYHRLEEDPNEVDADGVVLLNEVMILNNKRPVTYVQYRELNKQAEDQDTVQQYAGFVGRKCYRRMLLYRS